MCNIDSVPSPSRIIFAITVLLAVLLLPLSEVLADDVPVLWYNIHDTAKASNISRKAACENFVWVRSATQTWTYTWASSSCSASSGALSGVSPVQSCPSSANMVFLAATGNDQAVCRFPTSCDPPNIRQIDGSCVAPPPTCEDKKGQQAGGGSYLMGNTPTTPFPNTACVSGCAVNFSGNVPGAQQLVSGKYQYYAVGTYDFNGFECSAGEGGMPSPSPLPPPSCGAGQVMGQVNGKTVCVNNGNGQIDNPHTPEKTEEKTKTPPVENPDGSTTETETTTRADGSTTVVTTTTNPDGSTTTTTTVQPGAGSTSSGSQQGSGNQNGNNPDPKVDICTENPNIPACKDADSGDAASTDGLYEVGPDRKTFATILEGFAGKVTQLGWYQSVSGFFNVQVPSGSCGGMSGSVGFGGYSFDYDLDAIFCGSAAQTMYSILSIGVQLAATWIAFSIAFL